MEQYSERGTAGLKAGLISIGSLVALLLMSIVPIFSFNFYRIRIGD